MELRKLLSSEFLCIIVILNVFISVRCNPESEESSSALFNIEGKVLAPQSADQDWIASTKIIADGGAHLGFLKSDGSFLINNVPSGSYIVEVVNPTFVFEPYRVDITSKGKTRARKLNNLQPSAVHTVAYPLKFKSRGRAHYFQQREQWRITDFLFTPMMLMMFVPFLLIMLMPKLMNTADPETQREMQQMFNPKQNMPDISETLTNWLGGGPPASAAKKSIKAKPPKKK